MDKWLVRLKVGVSATLVVALTFLKGKLEATLTDWNLAIAFGLFVVVVFFLIFVEMLFEPLFRSSWLKKYFFKRRYICGCWLNYATRPGTNEISNYSILYIENTDDGKAIVGEAFQCFRGAPPTNEYVFVKRGKFSSRMSKYSEELMRLEFTFQISDTEETKGEAREVFGVADYSFFSQGGQWPRRFSGKFTRDKLNSPYCSVTGVRVVEEGLLRQLKDITDDKARFKAAIRYLTDQRLVPLDQIKVAPPGLKHL